MGHVRVLGFAGQVGQRSSAESVMDPVQVWQQELRLIAHSVGVHLGDVGGTEGLSRISDGCCPSVAAGTGVHSAECKGQRTSAKSEMHGVQVWRQELRLIAQSVGVHQGEVGGTEVLSRNSDGCCPGEAAGTEARCAECRGAPGRRG